ncbi:MAG: outer membrane lipoprotein carrier protein LolA [Deltaproteobacteria bacterium]|nr:outer membrane lipoprotein carrier protein LolA [Deltaproteobacteria bacterium]
MKRRHLLLSFGAAWATALWGDLARADAVEEALKRVVAARRPIKTMQASFRQKRVIGLLAAAVESKGQLTIVQPGRLRWDLLPPDGVTYWIGPEGLAMANKDGVAKVGKSAAGRFATVLSDLLVMLGGDMIKLRKRYKLSITETEGRLVLTAKPKSKKVAKHIAKLRMETGDKLWQVKRVEIFENNGDQSIIDFDKMKKDLPIKPAFMKPPKS